MKLLEYEAKAILRSYAIPTPKSSIASASSASVTLPAVLKSQVPVGGRGKSGGIVVVKNEAELGQKLHELFALDIKGHTPRVILAEEVVDIAHEYYLSILINRSRACIELLAHKNGGIEVEENDQASFFTMQIDKNSNFNTLGQQLAEFYDLPGQTFLLQDLVERLYGCFVESDATLLEINPLILTTKNKLVAGDCKMTLDDAANFRHPEWQFEDSPVNANFVSLDPAGTVATIANGAGLAMATVDAVADAGLTPANFLDIGGGANEASVLKAFEDIMQYPHVTAIVINIFAGITRCDEVAKAIIAAHAKIPHLPKLYIRLAGTNYEAAKLLLEKASIPLLPSLGECLNTLKKEQA